MYIGFFLCTARYIEPGALFRILWIPLINISVARLEKKKVDPSGTGPFIRLY